MGYKPIEFFGIQYNDAVLEEEWWRLITSIFLHADFSHLLGNMLMLCYLSSILNNFYSDLEYWIVYMTSGLAGSSSYAAFYGRSDAFSGSLRCNYGFGRRIDLQDVFWKIRKSVSVCRKLFYHCFYGDLQPVLRAVCGERK